LGDWVIEVEEAGTELGKAWEARRAGNEGRARVCARRAAGLAIGAYYQRQAGPGWGGDAMAQLGRLKVDEAVPVDVRAAAARLSTVVDLDHKLPFSEDPLGDARFILAFVAAV
jgi:hypothetical protein